MLQTSIIIPVYNAAKYIERAVESIIHQDGVGEVILVDDGCPDGSLEICQELRNKYSKIRLLQHPNNENRGASASRNLGIKKAEFDYIAFLDADDCCLSNRFSITNKKFNEYPEANGVYEPTGTEYQSEHAKHIFRKWKRLKSEDVDNYITYPTEETEGQAFFESLIIGDSGYPHLNGITFKKSLFDETSLFDPSLDLHQDTDFLIRIAYHGYFVPGDKNHIVANRLVHDENRVAKLNYKSRYRLMTKLYEWAKQNKLQKRYVDLIKKKYIIAKTRMIFNSNGMFIKIIYNILYRIL